MTHSFDATPPATGGRITGGHAAMTARLEAHKPVAQARGLVGRKPVGIISTQMTGKAAKVVYQAEPGMIDSQILFRNKESECGPGPMGWAELL